MTGANKMPQDERHPATPHRANQQGTGWAAHNKLKIAIAVTASLLLFILTSISELRSRLDSAETAERAFAVIEAAQEACWTLRVGLAASERHGCGSARVAVPRETGDVFPDTGGGFFAEIEPRYVDDVEPYEIKIELQVERDVVDQSSVTIGRAEVSTIDRP